MVAIRKKQRLTCHPFSKVSENQRSREIAWESHSSNMQMQCRKNQLENSENELFQEKIIIICIMAWNSLEIKSYRNKKKWKFPLYLCVPFPATIVGAGAGVGASVNDDDDDDVFLVRVFSNNTIILLTLTSILAPPIYYYSNETLKNPLKWKTK